MSKVTRLGAMGALVVLGFSPMAMAQAAPTGPVTNADGSVSLPIKPQVQEKDEWCWIGSGTVVADYNGKTVSQNELCDRARGLRIGTECPNEPGSLSQLQRAYSTLGLQTGLYNYSALTYSSIRREIDSNRPALARIGWSSGGGHVLVLYGYKAADESVLWADPWPTAKRLNVTKYSYFKSNSDYTWTHSLSYVKGY